MKRTAASAIVFAAFVGFLSTAGAQDGAPLIDGLGGPVGLGTPHGGLDEVDLAPAFPDGLTYFDLLREPVIYFNWSGTLSFEYGFYSLIARLDAEVDYVAVEKAFLPASP